jgi:Family of unknown function (DUF6422)
VGLVLERVPYEELTDEQAETLDNAALLVINARQQAAAMLTDAGMVRLVGDDPWFNSPCTGNFDGSPCPCSDYRGPGPCRTRIAPPGVPIEDSTDHCTHTAVMHLSS